MTMSSRYERVVVLSVGALLALEMAEQSAGQATTRVSVDSGGMQANSGGFEPAISADGRYVAFASWASNLVPGDTNGVGDVFVHDRLSGATERVSVASGGAQAHGGFSNSPSISPDGRYVSFDSLAPDLVSGDTNSNFDVFVHDRQNGVTERVSIATGGVEGNGESSWSSISGDGRYVAFWSRSHNLVAGDTNGKTDIFVRDRQAGTTERVSVHSSGAEGNGNCAWGEQVRITPDGRYVAFGSESSNLVGGDSNGQLDIFVHDRQNGQTERVSVGSGGGQGNGTSLSARISADGLLVAFSSHSSNLVTGDSNGLRDTFVHDRQSGTTERVSISSSGGQANGESIAGAISADNNFVVFTSEASNHVDGDINAEEDVFLHNRSLGTTVLISRNSGGSQGNGQCSSGRISADGRFVAFSSSASNLVPLDTNGSHDIFVRDLSEKLGTNYCTANANSTGFPADIWATGSANWSAGNLRLTSLPIPNQNGIFFHGSSTAQLPFGNGFLCTTIGIVRGTIVMGIANVATYVYDNSDSEHSLAAFVGITRHFQHWFRDPLDGGALFNTSNGISIVILP